MPLILDASVLIGLLDSADSHHDQAVDAVDQADRADQALLSPASAYGELLTYDDRLARTARQSREP